MRTALLPRKKAHDIRHPLCRAPDKVVPLIVAVALLMENIDSSVLATALPERARDLSSDPIHLKLVLTSCLLALAVFIPVSGWAADRFGARTLFRAASAPCPSFCS